MIQKSATMDANFVFEMVLVGLMLIVVVALMIEVTILAGNWRDVKETDNPDEFKTRPVGE